MALLDLNAFLYSNTAIYTKSYGHMSSCDLQMSNFHLSLSVKEGGSLVWETQISKRHCATHADGDLLLLRGVRSYMLSVSIPSVREGDRKGRIKPWKWLGVLIFDDAYWHVRTTLDLIKKKLKKNKKLRIFFLLDTKEIRIKIMP